MNGGVSQQARVAKSLNAKPKRSVREILRRKLIAMSDGWGDIVAHESKDWGSMSFSGSRHVVTMRFPYAPDIPAMERELDNFRHLPGQLVADCEVEVSGSDLTATILLLEDS